MLRFMADEYDDTCSTVFPLLQTVLSSVSICKLMNSDMHLILGHSTNAAESSLPILLMTQNALFWFLFWKSF